jgi:fructose-bisphosphate aldolase class II
MKEILDTAYKGGYGVPAVPSANEIQIRASIEAAVEAKSPLIFLCSNRNLPEWNHEIIRYFASQVDIPIASCLDHSRTYEDCVLGIRTGLTCIMADRSELPYEENMSQVLALATIAHAVGVSIEGELGHVGQGNNYAVDGVSALTDPKEARRFIDDTGVDGLAVAVGTAHGVYVGTPKLDFGRLAEINAACGIPLVLHGGSGSGEDNIHKACSMGIAKVNIVTDILAATVNAAKEGDFSGNNGHRFYAALSKATKDIVIHLFEVTGSTGKAAGAKKGINVGNDEKSTQEK